MREIDPKQLFVNLLRELKSAKEYPRDHVARACDLITSREPESRLYTAEFFKELVEPLCDSFSPSDVSLYNRVFAQVIQACRKDRAALTLDRELASFGLIEEQDLVKRAERINSRTGRLLLPESDEVRRAIVLSRITLGADVAVTSVIINGLAQLFPEAEIVLIGGPKLRELFGGDRRLHFREVDYHRAGSLIDRLLVWTEVLRHERHLGGEADSDTCIVVDPDSRLTQLGLLPLARDDNYFFFPSRCYRSDSPDTLANLAAGWLNELSSGSVHTTPMVRPSPNDLVIGRQAVASLRGPGSSPVVTVNFGVGENASKRVADDFEGALIAELVKQGMRVILDKGAGEDEARRVEAAIEFARSHLSDRELSVVETNETVLPETIGRGVLGCDLLTWSGRVGILAGFIRESDLYIGYDSAGQHIAAALNVPCIDVFAGAGSQRFRDRWSPAGGARSIVIDTSDRSPRAVLDETLANVKKLLR